MTQKRKDLTQDLWEKGIVGIWYGGWTPADLRLALKKYPSTQAQLKYLNSRPRQKALNEKEWAKRRGTLPKAILDTGKRFCNEMSKNDWVFVYFNDALHLARPGAKVLCDIDSPWNRDGGNNLFKYRIVSHKKCFPLSDLPDAFRLLSSAGRGNVHELKNGRPLIEILGRSSGTREANSQLENLGLEDWLNIMGPNSWESFCEAYLILERGFLPTGLSVGKTMSSYYIVGRRRDGRRIFAQCKKDPKGEPIDEDFPKAIDSTADFYYFSYGPVHGKVPARVTPIGKREVLDWLRNTPNGRLYEKLLREA